MKTSYIINALSISGDWIYLKHPVTLNYQYAIKRAHELAKQANIQESEVTTVSGKVIRTFVNRKYLKTFVN